MKESDFRNSKSHIFMEVVLEVYSSITYLQIVASEYSGTWVIVLSRAFPLY